MSETAPPRHNVLRLLGPGLVVAAAGIGAGDVVTASTIGARHGHALLWVLPMAVAVKLVLNEAMARWQLATGSTLMEAIAQRLPGPLALAVLGYLAVWTFMVGASLLNACGLAGHSIVPAVPAPVWSVVLGLAAAWLCVRGAGLFEQVMKALVGAMVLLVVVCAMMTAPRWGDVLRGLVWPSWPAGSGRSVLSALGGIGGSMTLLCYGQGMRRRGWSHPRHQRAVQRDLVAAYAVTLVFAVALTLIAAGLGAALPADLALVTTMANHLQTTVGAVGRWCFLLGFACAVFTATLGVWQAVPPLFSEWAVGWARRTAAAPGERTRRRIERAALLFLVLPPLLTMVRDNPIAAVLRFTVVGSVALPLQAAVLLGLEADVRRAGAPSGGLVRMGVLWGALLLFGYAVWLEVRAS